MPTKFEPPVAIFFTFSEGRLKTYALSVTKKVIEHLVNVPPHKVIERADTMRAKSAAEPPCRIALRTGSLGRHSTDGYEPQVRKVIFYRQKSQEQQFRVTQGVTKLPKINRMAVSDRNLDRAASFAILAILDQRNGNGAEAESAAMRHRGRATNRCR